MVNEFNIVLASAIEKIWDMLISRNAIFIYIIIVLILFICLVTYLMYAEKKRASYDELRKTSEEKMKHEATLVEIENNMDKHFKKIEDIIVEEIEQIK